MCHVDTGERVEKCRVRGIMFRDERRFSKPVAVGDRVWCERRKTPPPVVVEVDERRNYLSRPLHERRREQIIAANLDQAVLVLAALDPPPNFRLLDRMLVACERHELRSLIVMNKIDLIADREAHRDLMAVYEDLGYPCLETSTVTGEGIDDLREGLRDSTSVFSGMSGVGKSALLTAVQPDLALRSGEVSDATGKGKHTTTHVALLKLAAGGYVVDTPGIREFGLSELEAPDVARLMVDFREQAGRCKFRRCTHTHEIDCAVKLAVEAGEIDELRYDSYLRIIESIEDAP